MRRVELLFAAACAFVFSNVARAQTPYLVTQTVGTWSEITSGGTVYTPTAYGTLSAWDEGAAMIPLPFTFTWYGQPYSTIYAFTNGFMSFNPPPTNVSLLPPPSIVPNQFNLVQNFVGVMWADLEGGAAPEIRAVSNGSVGSRIFTVQMRGLRGFANPLSNVNFQVRLSESTNTLEVVFGPNNGIGQVGTTAMANLNGTEGMNLMDASTGCTGACTCLPAGCGSLNWVPSGRTITITLPNGPELAGEISGPPGAFPGTQFDAIVHIRNLGLTATGPFDYEIRLASTHTSTAGSTLLESVSVPAGIAPSTTMTSTRTLTMPANAGVADYYLALIIDRHDDVMEVVETNNLVFSPDVISTAPDIIGSISIPMTGGPGEPIDVRVSARSTGAPVASPIGIAFYLSEDDLLDAGDLPMGNELLTFPDGFSGSATYSETIPANALPSPPFYQVLAVFDDQNTVAETNEVNNTANSDVIRLDGPDVVATALACGPFGFLGEPLPVIATVKNQGGARAVDLTVCVVISTNQLISVISDPILIETAPLTLLPGEEAPLNLAPVIPASTSTGTWYIAVVGDCQDIIPEQLETNNVKRRVDPITIRPPAADFAPLEVVTATGAAAGETIPVSARIGNIGNVTGTALVRFVVSTNPGVTAMDTSIYETPVAITLDANMETSVTAWASLPGDLVSGAYWIGAIVDPLNTLDEVYEDNNALSTGPIAVAGANLAIITPNPPAAVIGVPYVRRFSAVGGTGNFTWELTFAEGAPPAGLEFDPASAELRGTPDVEAEGRHDFTVRVTSGNVFASRAYTLLVTPPTIPLSVVSSRLPPALRLEPYQIQLIAVGGTPPYTWAESGGDIPNGLAVSPEGELGGEPQDDPDGYNFSVTVTDVSGAHATGVLSIDIVATDVSVSITNADIPTGVVGQAYDYVFVVSGGASPHHWRLDVDQPIPGLSFIADEARLTGTPTVAGDYPIVVEVRDANGLIDRNAYVLEVLAPGDLVITTGNSPETQLPKGTVGVAYKTKEGEDVRLRAVLRSGTEPASLMWTIVDGMIAPGLSLDGPSGTISGTPSAEGTYPFRVLVTNPSGDFAFAALVIAVDRTSGGSGGGGDSGCSCSTTKRPLNAGGTLAFLAMLLLAGARKEKKRILLILFFLLALEPKARAQSVPYQVTIASEPYAQLTGATAIVPELADGNTVEIALPFTFYLYGTPVTSVYVNANGLLSITDIGYGHHYPPTQNPDMYRFELGFVAGLWDDWCSSAGCGAPFVSGIGVFYKIDAAAGTASFEWRHVRHWNDTLLSSDINFTITLYEGSSSHVEFTYGPMTQGTGSFPTFNYARIGIENLDATEGMWVGPCAGIAACDFAAIDNLENQKITIVADAGDDITVSSVGVPNVGYPGLPLDISARLISRHGQSLGPTRFAAYVIPTTATSTAGGTLVYSSEEITLAPFESRALNLSVEIPDDLPADTYRVAIVADYLGQLAETDEANNFARSLGTVRIADRGPDFRIVRVRPLSTQLAPGAPLQVAFTAQNFGNEPGVLELQGRLSSNDAITTADLAFGTAVQFNTVARQTVSGTISANLPSNLGTGTYYLGAIADEALAISELNENNNVGRSPIAITVSASNVQILTTELPPATLGVSYSANVVAAGGSGSFTYRLAGGTLPRGMNFDVAEAEVYGIPLDVGAFALEIEARSGTLTARKTLTLEVLDPTLPLTILSHQLPVATLGQDYAESIRVLGGVPPYAWKIIEGTLPRGILLGTDGVVFGQPSAVGVVPFTIEVRDNGTMTATASYVFETRSPGNLTIISSALPEGRVGEEYVQALFAIGGTSTVSWQAVTEPPPGLIVHESGAVRGVPERAGEYRFRVRAIDQITGVEDTNVLTISIGATGRFGISTENLPDGEPGQMYTATIQGEGGKKPYTWTLVAGEGALPPGFMGNATVDDFVVSGTLPADREGIWTFTLRLADSEGREDTRPFALVSRTKTPVVDPKTIDSGGCGCTSTNSALDPFALASLFIVLALLRKRA